jgi:hypothetical protein
MKSRDQTSVLLSVAAIRTAFNEFEADNAELYLVVECRASVELDIAIVKSDDGGLIALIEDNSSCSVTAFYQMDNGQWSLLTDVSDKQSIESNRSNLPMYYGETMTCKNFAMFIPAPKSTKLPIAQCLA